MQMQMGRIDDKSTLVQVMAWCRCLALIRQPTTSTNADLSSIESLRTIYMKFYMKSKIPIDKENRIKNIRILVNWLPAFVVTQLCTKIVYLTVSAGYAAHDSNMFCTHFWCIANWKH